MSSSAEEIGRIAALWRYPVKSMQGEQVDVADIDERGLCGDRAFALYDVDTGKVASAKSPRMWPNLVRDRDRLPPVTIELPGGAEIRTDDTAVDEILSEATGRKVRLVSSNSAGATFEQYVPAIEGADPEGGDFYRDVLTMGRFPCAGVYGLVHRPGTVRVGDAVRLVEEEEE